MAKQKYLPPMESKKYPEHHHIFQEASTETKNYRPVLDTLKRKE